MRLALRGVLMGVVAVGLMSRAEAEPPFPWRSRGGGPAPYSRTQNLRPAPRTRPAPARVSQGRRPEPLAGPELVAPQPTPIDLPAKTSPTAPLARPTRTYFTPKQPVAQYPSGHGMHIAVTEKFLDELIRVESQDAGPVKDCILGAEVVGSQQTDTSLHVLMIPSDDKAQLELQLSGTTRNSTENRTPQAVIQSEGNHRFEVSKSVQFDGKSLLTRSPSAMMYPCQRNMSALTPASAIPILGPLVSEYALSVAERSRPAAERITAQRITEQVVPQFNTAIDKRLAELNTQVFEVIPHQLPLLGISEPKTRVRTTDKQLTASFAWDTVRNCPEYVPTVTTSDAAELRVAIHAEAVNVWLASLPLGGVEIPVSDLDRWQKELERALSSSESVLPGAVLVSRSGRTRKVPARTIGDEQAEGPTWAAPTIQGPILLAPSGTVAPVMILPEEGVSPSELPSESAKPKRTDKIPTYAVPEPPASLGIAAGEPTAGEPDSTVGQGSRLMGQSTMVLAPENPITVEFHQGEAVITLVAAFRIAPAPQTEFHRIRIPLTSQLLKDELTVTPGKIVVETTASSPGPLAELTRSAIEKQVEQRLQPTHWPIERSLKREQGEPLTLRLGEMTSNAGWLSSVWGVETPSKSDLRPQLR